MQFIFGNFWGFLFCGAAFGIAFGVGHLLGIDGEGPLMILAGPLVAAFDLAYRVFAKDGHWFSPAGGGNIFFIPVWCLGTLWFFLGIAYTQGWAQ